MVVKVMSTQISRPQTQMRVLFSVGRMKFLLQVQIGNIKCTALTICMVKPARRLVLMDMCKIHIKFADVLKCLVRLRVTILNI